MPEEHVDDRRRDSVSADAPDRNVPNSDPGPIELGDVMKGLVPGVQDPMAGKDLSLGELGDNESDNPKR